MLIRRETEADVAAVREVTAEAFRSMPHSAPPVEPGGPPGEVTLLDKLRTDPGWMPQLSLVAEGAAGGDDAGSVVGHVVGTRGRVGTAPAVAVGPVSVLPSHQRRGVGKALLHAVLAAADALDEPLVVLLGDPAYYGRFGFRPAAEFGVLPPDDAWGAYFQVRTLSAYQPSIVGRFVYATPFDQL